MDDVITGIVAAAADYKEADQLVTVITPDHGRLTFYARGLKKPASKNAGACRLFSRSEFVCDYDPERGRQLLKTASLKDGRPLLQTDYQRLAIASAVLEVAAQADSEEPLYDLLDAALDRIESGQEPYTAACVFVGQTLKRLGIEPVVDGCAQCGATAGIEAISIEDGGFLCHECNRTTHLPAMTVEQLHRFRLVNKASFDVYDKVMGLGLDQWPLLELMLLFLSQYSGLRLRSMRSLVDLNAKRP